MPSTLLYHYIPIIKISILGRARPTAKPALLTSRLTFPFHGSRRFFTFSRSVTSRLIHSITDSPSSAFNASSLSVRRATSTNCQFDAASFRAVASQNPELTPVILAILFTFNPHSQFSEDV